MKQVIYVHYGSDTFYPEFVLPVRNGGDFRPKPDGGLWASREDDPFGWKA